MEKENKGFIKELSRWIGVPSSWINKYSVVSILFLVWILFLDRYNVFAYNKLTGIIHKLEEEKSVYEEKIQQAQLDKKDLESDHEKFAREKHLMHKPNEEIVLIRKEKK
ncbi:MAG: septum formation initiator family protein [Saprospiraceae bacterium]|nr:septum formation initiator family protein [Saprospiraceae bacterium]